MTSPSGLLGNYDRRTALGNVFWLTVCLLTPVATCLYCYLATFNCKLAANRHSSDQGQPYFDPHYDTQFLDSKTQSSGLRPAESDVMLL